MRPSHMVARVGGVVAAAVDVRRDHAAGLGGLGGGAGKVGRTGGAGCDRVGVRGWVGAEWGM